MKSGDFWRGMGAGLVAGIAITLAMGAKKKAEKPKGTASRTVKAIGDLLTHWAEGMGC